MKKIHILFLLALAFGFQSQLKAQDDPEQDTLYNFDGDIFDLAFGPNPYFGSGFNWGDYLGHSVYGGDGFAERYEVSGEAWIVGIMGFIVNAGGEFEASDEINLSVFGIDGDYPSENVEATVAIPVAQIQDGMALEATYGELESAHRVEGNFYVGMEIEPYRSAVADRDDYQVYLLGADRTDGPENLNAIRVSNDGEFMDNWLTPTETSLSKDVYMLIFPVVSYEDPEDGGDNGGDPTSVESVTKVNGLSLMPAYPNPSNDVTNLHFSLENQGLVNIQLFNAKGQVVKQIHNGQLANGEYFIQVEMNDLNNGQYIYVIQTEDAVLSGKVLKK